jgi:hypothetical protein
MVYRANSPALFRCVGIEIEVNVAFDGPIFALINTCNQIIGYMVIASLAWSLKAWSAILLPVTPRWQENHAQEKQQLLRKDLLPASVAQCQRGAGQLFLENFRADASCRNANGIVLGQITCHHTIIGDWHVICFRQSSDSRSGYFGEKS